MRKPKIIIKPAKGKKGSCIVVVKARNGKTLMTSEILSSYTNAIKNIYATAAVFDNVLEKAPKIFPDK